MAKGHHGLTEIRKRVGVRGVNASIDRRTSGARELLAWRTELIEALGGKGQLSPQLGMLVEQVTRLKLYLDHTDAFLLALPSIIVKRRKEMVPLMRERIVLATELRATLQLIGLKAIPKLVSPIDDDWMKKISAVENERPAI